jgi:hypothetical protein
MSWTVVAGLVLVVVAVAIGISVLALLLVSFYLAWVNPEKLREFQRNVVSRWPGYALLSNDYFDSPLTKWKLWATRVSLGLVLLAIAASIILMIRPSS